MIVFGHLCVFAVATASMITLCDGCALKIVPGPLSFRGLDFCTAQLMYSIYTGCDAVGGQGKKGHMWEELGAQ